MVNINLLILGMTINDRELKIEVSRKTRGDEGKEGREEGDKEVSPSKEARPEGEQTTL